MPATFEKSKGDQTWFWVVVYSIESRRIAMELISQDTAFGTKHLLDANYETAMHRKNRRDLQVFDDDGPASAIYLFRNFNDKTFRTNTVIEYNTPAELHSLLAKAADAFGKVTDWPKGRALKLLEIDFGKECVHPESVGCNHKKYKKAELGAFLKGQSGNAMTIVIKHLDRHIA